MAFPSRFLLLITEAWIRPEEDLCSEKATFMMGPSGVSCRIQAKQFGLISLCKGRHLPLYISAAISYLIYSGGKLAMPILQTKKLRLRE